MRRANTGHSPQRRLAVCVMGTVALTGAGLSSAAAQQNNLPELDVGSSIFWSTIYDGTASSFRERLIASGDDWQIFHSIYEGMEDEPLGPESLFVVYSGIDYRSCGDGALASADERKAVAGLWPLTEGASVALTTLEDPITIHVGEPTEFYLMGQTHPAHTIQIEYGDQDLNEQIVVLDELPLTVRMDWDETSWDKVMSVSGPKTATLETPTAAELGICAALLESK